MLRKTTGNMYEFITHTWNPIKGRCSHDCAYCYMKQITPNANPPILVDYELNTDLGNGNFIFIGSSTDMFADDIPSEWIKIVLDYCSWQYNKGKKNKFLLQSKNPKRFLEFINHPIVKCCEFGTTIESNRFYPGIMRNAPRIEERVDAMEEIAKQGFNTIVTAEPLMQFDLDDMLQDIHKCQPILVNIGRNTSNNVKLPEPTLEEVKLLVNGLKEFTEVHIKKNARVWFT